MNEISENLLRAFSKLDFMKVGQKAEHLIELSFACNKITGKKFARAVFEDGVYMIKEDGKEDDLITCQINSIEDRTMLIKALYDRYTQLDIAAMLNISQGTVSAAINRVGEE